MNVSTVISYLDLLRGSGPVPVPDAGRLADDPRETGSVHVPTDRSQATLVHRRWGYPLRAHHAGSAGGTLHPTRVISTVGSLGIRRFSFAPQAHSPHFAT